jgi:two-component system nitrate/nitrite sensor histidine kinase NarX
LFAEEIAGMAERRLRIVQEGRHPAGGPALAPAECVDALHDSPALRELLGRSLRAIVALTGAQAGAIRMVTTGEREMRLMGAVGLSPDWVAREQSVSSDCGMCGLALREDSLQLDTGSCGQTAALAGKVPCGPAVAVPLHCRGRAVGVFNLFFGHGSHLPIDPRSLVAPVGEMLEIALENALMEHERLRSSLVAERHMLAAEVHDSLAQGLAFMRMRMSLLHDALDRGERTRALKYAGDVDLQLGEAHARLRSLITQFRHTDEQGLVEALRITARDFEERTGVALRIESRAGELRLPPGHQAAVYQIVQEALANVIKHAGARNVRVRIERSPRRLQVLVEDDGCGLARASEEGGGAGHFGLEIMRERAQRIGGNLEIRSAPRRGTRVRLVVPAAAMARQAR